MPSEMRFGEVKKMLKSKGYFLHHVSGSHHIFKNRDGGHYTLPVRNGKVKAFYVKEIKKLKSD
jgi:predicted RNA binding protein YcfA (HicA-like mRNA interferase family)